MRALAVVPVKRFGSAKRRLAPALDESSRRRLAEAMLGDVLERLAGARSVAGVVVVSGDPRAASIATGAGAEVIDDPTDIGHPQAAGLGIELARHRGIGAVALLPGDCPLIDAAEVDEAIARLESAAVVVVPDRHGEGTNGLLLRPPDAIVPAFGPGSRRRHVELARGRGLAAEVAELGSLGLDLDTADDLRALAEAVAAAGPAAPTRTARALAALGPGVAAGRR
jgi:2-phospho-L-lactate/phosphoenolpyruvate guanylyltransferase